MANELLDELRAALEQAAQTARGRKAVQGHDEDFDLEIAGYGTLHLAISGGRFELSHGPSERRQALRYTLVQIDGATLRAILAGAVSPVAAMEQGRLFLRTRLYGGALVTILLRAAYDVARAKRLSSPTAVGEAR